MKRLLILAALLTGALIGPAGQAQYQHYENESQFNGGAYFALSTKPFVVAGLTRHCARVDRATRAQARATHAAWKARNAGYDPLLRQLRKEMRASAKRENALPQWRAMNETAIPAFMQTNLALLVSGIDSAPADQRAARCAELLQQVDNGRMDLSQEPAGLGAHIERRRAEIAGETARE